MNLKCTARTYLFLFLLGIAGACKSKGAEQIDVLNGLINTSDSVKSELAAIDPIAVETMLVSSSDVKGLIIATLKADTLELEFARKLDAFLTANRQLEHLNADRLLCEASNSAIHTRLLQLKTDMENSAGERSAYNEYLKKEALEMRKIRKHSMVLKSRFDASELCITQFQPEIERYLYRFVPK